MTKGLQEYVSQINVNGALRAGTELMVSRKRKSLSVVLRREKVAGRGRWQCLTSQTRIRMAFDRDCRARTLGGKYDVHSKTASRNNAVIAKVC